MPFVTMKKYNISPEYGIFARFTPPFHKALFPISSFVLGLVPKMLRSNADVKIAKKQPMAIILPCTFFILSRPRRIKRFYIYTEADSLLKTLPVIIICAKDSLHKVIAR